MGSATIAIAAKLGVRIVPMIRRQRFVALLAWTAGALLLAWLDSSASPLALHAPRALHVANIVSAIVTGIQILAGWVATAAEVTAAYVWVALQWLGAATATLLRNTGAMFAKVWDATKIVWSDVLKPALVWVDDHLKRLYGWLKDTFQPVFDFLRDVRDRLHAFYATFVRPVIDTIEWLRQINRVLLAFHITFLQALDRTLQQIEQRIEEPFLWVNEQLNKVWNALDLVVTLDGFFQRLTLLRSMNRYAPDWIRSFYNAQRPAHGKYPNGVVDGLDDALAPTDFGGQIQRAVEADDGPISAGVSRLDALVRELAEERL